MAAPAAADAAAAAVAALAAVDMFTAVAAADAVTAGSRGGASLHGDVLHPIGTHPPVLAASVPVLAPRGARRRGGRVVERLDDHAVVAVPAGIPEPVQDL